MSLIIAEIIPLLLFYVFFAYPDKMLLFSLTPLGRLIAVCIIIFYTNISLVFGLGICILVIFYYQMDMIEGMEDSHLTILSNRSANFAPYSPVELSSADLLVPLVEAKQSSTKKRKYEEEGWDIFEWIEDQQTSIEQFENINQGQGQGQGQSQSQSQNDNVQESEHINHIFPQIKFQQIRCGENDSQCKMTILQDKLSAQEDITYPKQSDWVSTVWQTWFSQDNTKPYAAFGIISENFSKI